MPVRCDTPNDRRMFDAITMAIILKANAAIDVDREAGSTLFIPAYSIVSGSDQQFCCVKNVSTILLIALLLASTIIILLVAATV